MQERLRLLEARVGALEISGAITTTEMTSLKALAQKIDTSVEVIKERVQGASGAGRLMLSLGIPAAIGAATSRETSLRASPSVRHTTHSSGSAAGAHVFRPPGLPLGQHGGRPAPGRQGDAARDEGCRHRRAQLR